MNRKCRKRKQCLCCPPLNNYTMRSCNIVIQYVKSKEWFGFFRFDLKYVFFNFFSSDVSKFCTTGANLIIINNYVFQG